VPNRIIKETICTSEDIAQLSFGAEVLFYRLMVKADDFGCYHGNLKIIKNTCFPLKADDIKDKQIVEWLNELVNVGMIFFYAAGDGKLYLKLTKWEKHQQKRAKNSKFPTPDDDDVTVMSDDFNCNQLLTYVPENRESRNENRESRIENTDTAHTSTSKPEKIKYADFVSLTNAEYEALVAKLGEEATKRCIEILDNYKGATGKKYKSDYRAILNWVVERYEEEKRRNQQDKPKTNNPFLDLAKEEGLL